MAETKISWTHQTVERNGQIIEVPGYTQNFWYGCTEWSPGCARCYARTLMQDRYGRVTWGVGEERQLTTLANRRKPYSWNRAAAVLGVRSRVFSLSLGDAFDSEVPVEWSEELWQTVRQTPWLDWLILTKRAENLQQWLYGDRHDPPLFAPDQVQPNLWLGVSVCVQKEVEKIDELLAVHAPALRFLSLEPQLEAIDLRQHLPSPIQKDGYRYFREAPIAVDEYGFVKSGEPSIHWVIVGGESDRSKSHPFHLEWAEQIVDQCAEAGVRCFVKQLGSNPVCQGKPYLATGFKSDDVNLFPARIQVQQVPPPAFTPAFEVNLSIQKRVGNGKNLR